MKARDSTPLRRSLPPMPAARGSERGTRISPGGDAGFPSRTDGDAMQDKDEATKRRVRQLLDHDPLPRLLALFTALPPLRGPGGSRGTDTRKGERDADR